MGFRRHAEPFGYVPWETSVKVIVFSRKNSVHQRKTEEKCTDGGDDYVAATVEVADRGVATDEGEDVRIEAILRDRGPSGADGVDVPTAVVCSHHPANLDIATRQPFRGHVRELGELGTGEELRRADRGLPAAARLLDVCTRGSTRVAHGRATRSAPRMIARKIAVRAEIGEVPRPEFVRQGGLDQLRCGAVGLAEVVPGQRFHGAARRAADEAALGEPKALVAATRAALAGPIQAVGARNVARVDVVVVVPRRWEREAAETEAVPSVCRGEAEGLGRGAVELACRRRGK